VALLRFPPHTALSAKSARSVLCADKCFGLGTLILAPPMLAGAHHSAAERIFNPPLKGDRRSVGRSIFSGVAVKNGIPAPDTCAGSSTRLGRPSQAPTGRCSSALPR